MKCARQYIFYHRINDGSNDYVLLMLPTENCHAISYHCCFPSVLCTDLASFRLFVFLFFVALAFLSFFSLSIFTNLFSSTKYQL